MDEKQKRFVVLGVSSLLLVAMIIAATIGLITNDTDKNDEISTSNKAITSICQSVDYPDACIKSLSSKGDKVDDPKELIKIGFEEAMRTIQEAANKSSLLQELHQDPRTKGALASCTELTDMSMNDLKRSFEKFVELDLADIEKILSDLKIWISGSMTYEETCLDGFHDTTGDAAEKMREVLKSATQLTTNALAMVTEIAFAFTSIGALPTTSNRRLLAVEGLPDWVDSTRRSLIEAKPGSITADLVVAKDGSGNYKTINEAVKDIPKNSNKTFVLYIKEGVYEEKVQFNSSLTHLMVIGDGPTKTRITGKLNRVDGIPTFHTATVVALGDYFIGKDIGFENTAGSEKEQAVALRVGADKSIFFNCQMDGYQDTLYVHAHRQFYRDCVISGTIDFIFGDSSVVFQNCTLLIRKPLDDQQCIVTAQGRKNIREPTGIVLQNCTITADASLYPYKNSIRSYLARPWKQFSRTIIMESYIDDVIMPDGYLPWNETFALDTLFYTEFNNRGPMAMKERRVQWPGIKELTVDRIQRFTASHFLDGDSWIMPTKVPYAPGLIMPPPTTNPIAASPVTAAENIDVQREGKQQLYDEIKSFNDAPPTPPIAISPFDSDMPVTTTASIAPTASNSEAASPSYSSEEVVDPFDVTLTVVASPELAQSAPIISPEAAHTPSTTPNESAMVTGTAATAPSSSLESVTLFGDASGESLAPATAKNATSIAPETSLTPESTTPSYDTLGEGSAPQASKSADSLTHEASKAPESTTPSYDTLGEGSAPQASKSADSLTHEASKAPESTTPSYDTLGEGSAPQASKSADSLTHEASKAPESTTPSYDTLGEGSAPQTSKSADSLTHEASQSPESTTPSYDTFGEGLAPQASKSADSLTHEASQSPESSATVQEPLASVMAPEKSKSASSPLEKATSFLDSVSSALTNNDDSSAPEAASAEDSHGNSASAPETLKSALSQSSKAETPSQAPPGAARTTTNAPSPTSQASQIVTSTSNTDQSSPLSQALETEQPLDQDSRNKAPAPEMAKKAPSTSTATTNMQPAPQPESSFLSNFL